MIYLHLKQFQINVFNLFIYKKKINLFSTSYLNLLSLKEKLHCNFNKKFNFILFIRMIFVFIK